MGESQAIIESSNHFSSFIQPLRHYSSIELFAGAGGMALGMEKAGLHHILLNDFDKYATQTLKKNRPEWNVVHGDVGQIDFMTYKGKVDLLTGGFPCQTFSYAGKKMGMEDTRGTLFYEFARALKESEPKVFLAENVKGLFSHDRGRTLQTMVDVFESMGYEVLSPKVLKAIHYHVPQKRERVFIVGIKKEYANKVKFEWPKESNVQYTLKDALKKGTLFSCDVPMSKGQTYPEKKKKVLDLVPAGGYWRNLPLALQKEYMMKSFYLGGGKTGIARRIAWDEACLTLTCSPAQKQTERCHPDETRPFQVREYARIQTFPDTWIFEGSMTQQYKQIGNAVPVNLAFALGTALIQTLNDIEDLEYASV
ncbi:MAG: DNA-cytosine methyltransferase (EC [uncultured Sulfurovum sp.]|uniref:Cytosine-specific methyltransferase n=1 Tax=uncultured Sulfurovum sp. TaxID=269237 RepID=A0A6S6TVB9_9BACT|nr:MAG: DNA-cytosine methyltransferase (EC [uncultured Sulfurovum sp.]